MDGYRKLLREKKKLEQRLLKIQQELDELSSKEGEFKLYRPLNDIEMESFNTQWCAQCRVKADGNGCYVRYLMLSNNVNSTEYPRELIRDDSGPRCTAYQNKYNERV